MSKMATLSYINTTKEEVLNSGYSDIEGYHDSDGTVIKTAEEIQTDIQAGNDPSADIVERTSSSRKKKRSSRSSSKSSSNTSTSTTQNITTNTTQQSNQSTQKTQKTQQQSIDQSKVKNNLLNNILINQNQQQSKLNTTKTTTSKKNDTQNNSKSNNAIVLDVQPASKVFGEQTGYQKFRSSLSKSQMDAKTNNASFLTMFKGVGAMGLSAGISFVDTVFVKSALFVKDVVTHPIQTGKNLAGGIKTIVTDANARNQIRENIRITAQEDPGKVIGTSAGFIYGPKVISATTNKVATVIKNLKVKAISAINKGSKIPAEEVFSTDVLTKQTKFPMSTGTKSALKQFNKVDDSGNIVVQTSAPSKLQGTTAGAGRKGAVGLEDAGIYVTPKGEGSPAFLRLSSADDAVRITIDPTKQLREALKQPTVTEFTVSKVAKIPSSVTSKAGFKAVEGFFKSQTSAKAFITKRSQIGQGEIARQSFVATENFKLPVQSMSVTRNGKLISLSQGQKVKVGDIIREAGTSELEAVIPTTSKLVSQNTGLAGFKDYTMIDGVAVPIRKVSVVADTVKQTSNAVSQATGATSKIVSVAKVQQGTSALSSQLDKVSYVSPTNSLLSAGSAISKLSSSSNNNKLNRLDTTQSTIETSQISSSPGGSSIVDTSKTSYPRIDGVDYTGSYKVKRSSKGSSGKSSSKSSSPVSEDISYPNTSSPSSPVSSSPGGSNSYSNSKRSSPTSTSSSSSSQSDQYNYINSNPSNPFSSMSNLAKKQQGYNVLVRQSGVWNKINIKALTKASAIKQGALKVGTSAAASFKIMKSNSYVRSNSNVMTDLSDFNKSSKEENVWVEKLGRRIKSTGELKEITYKGIATNKFKSVFNKKKR